MGGFIFAVFVAGVFFYFVAKAGKEEEPGKEALSMLGVSTFWTVIGVVGFLILGSVLLSLFH